MLDKTFNPAEIEARWYRHWETSGAFRPDRPQAKPYTIVLPPPNVTGSLHIGHALDHSLQDILIRWQRMKGRDARWVVGTDHAGIATQMVVERQLGAENVTRQELGREAFLARVWEWKQESGGAITAQMRRLGASADWANERFTMDEGFTKAVVHSFVELHERGLIYRDKRLVNWDPKFRTAISDLEVETREVQGHFWHFRYPLADGSGHVVVATTRPETMLGDTAVAVHPDDERYRAFVGKMVAHPLTGRQIPVIADTWADPALGTGVVKITPAHDFNDWQVYERNRDIGHINILDENAHLLTTDAVPAPYRGLERFAARKRIVADMEALGLLEQIEEKTVQMPYGDRSGVVIEPWLTDQWYVDAAQLAVAAREAVANGKTAFVPKSWEKTYFNWLDNIQPWCISRQLWWGHRIPAWYGPDGSCFVAKNLAAAQAQAGPDVELVQDEDVLDTWFSSGLWPMGTLGWPDATLDLERHYPTDVLVTGFDIIFFWVARMMMLGIAMEGQVPFRTVYCHGLVRDAKGQKMSKSKGNTVDPLTLVDKYGADATRFTLAAMESQGRDVRFDEKRVEGYRNFATKLWNAVRFAQAQGIMAAPSPDVPAAKLAVNRWIIAETRAMAATVETALGNFRYDQYADHMYHFVWNIFCDWYLELLKPLLALEGDEAAESRQVAGWVIDRILVCLHPLMPFITEELWHAQGARATDLIHAPWPDLQPCEDTASAEIRWLIELVSAIRSARTELNVPPGARLALHVTDADAALTQRLERQLPALQRLARIESMSFRAAPAGGMAQIVVAGTTYALPLAGVIDLAAERARLRKALETANKEVAALTARLSNPGFVERAKPEAVDKARDDLAARTRDTAHFAGALERLGPDH